MNAEHVRAAAFEAAGAGSHLPVKAREIQVILHHVPAKLPELQLIPDLGADIKQRTPFGRE